MRLSIWKGSRYDDLCELVRVRANAKSAIVIVLDGDLGFGMSVQASGPILAQVPSIMRNIAYDIEQTLKENRPPLESV
jgi:hypothetical protein